MIASLRLQNFRSHIDSQFEFENGVTIVVGPNGSGKTSLLEGLQMACNGQSFKAASEVEVIRDGTTWARVDVVTTDNNERAVKLSHTDDNAKVLKQFVLNGESKSRLPKNTNMPVVLFEPQDLLVLTLDPGMRRDFLDVLLSETLPHYAQHLKNYKRVLSQRNTLLKRHKKPSQDELFIWDLRLAELGSSIHGERKRIVEYMNATLSEKYAAISGRQDTVFMRYLSDETAQDYAEYMLAKLHQNYHKDLERGFTTVGPHRDDFLIELRQRTTKTTASRGENRSMMLALKLIHAKLVEEVFGRKPLILLDDVFSELDGSRRQRLASSLQGYQSIVTTTDADLAIDHFNRSATIVAL